jgi:hypothetical protein
MSKRHLDIWSNYYFDVPGGPRDPIAGPSGGGRPKNFFTWSHGPAGARFAENFS